MDLAVAPSLPDDLRRALGLLAREAALHALDAGPEPRIPDSLGHAAGALVSIEIDGRPLGFLGSLTMRPVADAVADAARMAASRDPRFEPNELDGDMQLVVWLTGPMRTIERVEDLSTDDGVMVSSGLNRGVYIPGLPSLAEGTEGVLVSACVAADLHPDAWRRPEVEVRAFPVRRL